MGEPPSPGPAFCVLLTRTCPSLIHPKPCPAYLHLQPASPGILCRGASHTEERKQTEELAVTCSALTGDTDKAKGPPASSPSVLTPGRHFTVPSHTREVRGCTQVCPVHKYSGKCKPADLGVPSLDPGRASPHAETKESQTARGDRARRCTDPFFQSSKCLGGNQ